MHFILYIDTLPWFEMSIHVVPCKENVIMSGNVVCKFWRHFNSLRWNSFDVLMPFDFIYCFVQINFTFTPAQLKLFQNFSIEPSKKPEKEILCKSYIQSSIEKVQRPERTETLQFSALTFVILAKINFCVYIFLYWEKAWKKHLK